MTKTMDEVRESFEASPFFSHIGFEIVQFEEGDVRLKLPIHEKLYNVNGTLHGGVHATMIDLILGMAIRSTTKTRCTTMNLNINYLAPASGGEIQAEGRILKQGYRIVTAEGELYDQAGDMIAKGIGTFKLIRDG
ncbi:PaaI family thioesterase [Halobacillus karajensis]|uniref:Domain 1 n=1 Tax=Halobacillus karajensis TaxID=195088 RepID=A0A024P4W1_9BACI|nr:PaaI family thioesterase [Halobacillus karajensis]CDQ19060.1 putative domain 1 [Halobacillus karajensis]CDQ22866.1 putative domain 1 [Halobacillus karajensis]CDQ26348.1 putative domain 1 [Halobacillus karajensis]